MQSHHSGIESNIINEPRTRMPPCNRTIVGLKGEHHRFADEIRRALQSHHSGIESSGQLAQSCCHQSCNRTIVGLKVYIFSGSVQVHFTCNRTIVGLKVLSTTAILHHPLNLQSHHSGIESNCVSFAAQIFRTLQSHHSGIESRASLEKNLASVSLAIAP